MTNNGTFIANAKTGTKTFIEYTDEEQAIQNEKNAKSNNSETKLRFIKEIRLTKLRETDWYSNSDVTMPDNIKTYRQNLRDIPANYDESKYDELLAADENNNLTHSVWSKP
tara:strand:+ start:616 stop:948 length:333 start_codon:yes stop_codon:yes gene_type:complete